MQLKEWTAGTTLGGFTQSVNNNPFDFVPLLTKHIPIPTIAGISIDTLFTQPAVGSLVDIGVDAANQTINKYLIGSGGRVNITQAGGEAFIDFSQIADTNSILGRIANQLKIGSVKIADFRF